MIFLIILTVIHIHLCSIKTDSRIQVFYYSVELKKTDFITIPILSQQLNGKLQISKIVIGIINYPFQFIQNALFEIKMIVLDNKNILIKKNQNGIDLKIKFLLLLVLQQNIGIISNLYSYVQNQNQIINISKSLIGIAGNLGFPDNFKFDRKYIMLTSIAGFQFKCCSNHQIYIKSYLKIQQSINVYLYIEKNQLMITMNIYYIIIDYEIYKENNEKYYNTYLFQNKFGVQPLNTFTFHLNNLTVNLLFFQGINQLKIIHQSQKFQYYLTYHNQSQQMTVNFHILNQKNNQNQITHFFLYLFEIDCGIGIYDVDSQKCVCPQNKVCQIIECFSHCKTCNNSQSCLNCFPGYFQNYNQCSLCSNNCEDCQSLFICHKCKNGFELQNGVCFKNICSICQENCIQNEQSLCQQMDFVYNDKCYDQCPQDTYKYQNTCKSCLEDGKYNQDCTIIIKIFIKKQGRIIYFSIPPDIGIKVQVSQKYVYNIKEKLIKIQTNLPIILININFSEFNQLRKRFIYQIQGQKNGLQILQNKYQIQLIVNIPSQAQIKIPKYINYLFVILFLFLNSLSIISLMLFVSIIYPQIVWSLIKIIASFAFIVGDNDNQSTLWRIFSFIQGQNKSTGTLSRAAFSNLFLIDAHAVIIMLILIIVLKKLASYLKYKFKSIKMQKIDKFFTLIIYRQCFGYVVIYIICFYNQGKNSNFTSLLKIFSIFSMITYIIVMVFFISKLIYQILHYQQDQKELFFLKKYDWIIGYFKYKPIRISKVSKSFNKFCYSIINPRFTIILDYIYMLSIVISIISVTENVHIQIYFTLIIQIMNILRYFLIMPYYQWKLNILKIISELFLIIFLVLGIYNNKIVNDQVLIQQNDTSSFKKFGYAMFFMLFLYLICDFICLLIKIIKRIKQNQSDIFVSIKQNIQEKKKKGSSNKIVPGQFVSFLVQMKNDHFESMEQECTAQVQLKTETIIVQKNGQDYLYCIKQGYQLSEKQMSTNNILFPGSQLLTKLQEFFQRKNLNNLYWNQIRIISKYQDEKFKINNQQIFFYYNKKIVYKILNQDQIINCLLQPNLN